MKVNTKVIFSFLIFLSLFLISLSYSLEESNAKPKDHLKKLRKAAYVIIALNKSKKPLEKIKEKPGRLARLVQFFTKLIYDPEGEAEKLRLEDIVRKRSTEAIFKKTEYYKQILKDNPNLTDRQRLGIAYYIGNRRPLFFQEYKDTAMKVAIEQFIKNTSGDNNLDLEYAKFLKSLFYLNEKKTYDLLSSLDKILLNLVLDFQGEFEKNFEEKDLKLFAPTNTEEDFLPSVTKPKIEEPKAVNTIDFKDIQIQLDSLKVSVDAINQRVKTSLKYYDEVAKEIKENDLLVGLRGLVKKIDDSGIEDEVKRATNKADILSLIIKIEQGNGSVADVVDVTKKVCDEIGAIEFNKSVDIAKTLEEIKTHFDKLQESQDISTILAEILIISGNIMTFSASPIHQQIAYALKFSGDELNTLIEVKNVINVSVEKSVREFETNYEQGRLTFNAQFFSDFALDGFVYNQIASSVRVQEIFAEKIESGWEFAREVLESVEKKGEEVLKEIERANEEGYIDRYADVGSDWGIGDSRYTDISTVVENDIVSHSSEESSPSSYTKDDVDIIERNMDKIVEINNNF